MDGKTGSDLARWIEKSIKDFAASVENSLRNEENEIAWGEPRKGPVVRHARDAYGIEAYGCGLCQTKIPCESGIPVKERK